MESIIVAQAVVMVGLVLWNIHVHRAHSYMNREYQELGDKYVEALDREINYCKQVEATLRKIDEVKR